MGLKKLKPMTPATRFYTVSTFEEVTRTKPEKVSRRSVEKQRRQK